MLLQKYLIHKMCQYAQYWAQTLAERDSRTIVFSRSEFHNNTYGENILHAKGSLSAERCMQMMYDPYKRYSGNESFSSETGNVLTWMSYHLMHFI